MSGPILLLSALAGLAVGAGLWLLLAVRYSRPSLSERLAEPAAPSTARCAPTPAGRCRAWARSARR